MVDGHILIAPDKFKGSLSARQVAEHLAAGLARALPGPELRQVPIADGGDGTLDAALAAGFRRVPVTASGPTGRPLEAAYAEADGVALVELAQASGLSRLPHGTRVPLRASSFGTGEMIRAALEDGCHTIVLGLGGSACTDGGAGMLQALGVHLRDQHGAELGHGGDALGELARADMAELHRAVGDTEFVVASDVDNPLLGRHGAAAIYGPQKGATAAQIAQLDAALARLAEVLPAEVGQDIQSAGLPGTGAAGGVGFAAQVVLGASMRPGIDYLLDLLGFHDQLPGTSHVITGEGSLDEQTLRGKAPAGVATAARAADVPVLAVAGRCSLTRAELAKAGFAAAYALSDVEPDPQRCITHAGPLLEQLASEHLVNELVESQA